MPKFIPLISEQEIKARVIKTGRKIASDYKGRDLVLLGVLKGAFIFLADLSRQIPIEHKIYFIEASSYKGTSSTGEVVLTEKVDLPLENKDVLIVEDIVDTGNTLSKLIDSIRLLNPRSIETCVLIDKKERREVNINIKHSCFKLEKGFIVGYGLDYNEKYRNLPAVNCMEL